MHGIERHIQSAKALHTMTVSGDDADLVHLRSNGGTDVIQQLSHTGEWTNQDLQAGSRLYARVKDRNPESFFMIRQGASENCFIDLGSGMNRFTIISS